MRVVCAIADKAAHDRLLAKAHAFCTKVAARYPCASSLAPPSAPATAPAKTPTERGVTFRVAPKQPESASVLFHAHIEWRDEYELGSTLEFPAQAPVHATIKFAVPHEAEGGKGFRLALSLPVPAPDEFTLAGLRVSAPPPPPLVTVTPVLGEQEHGKARKEERGEPPPRGEAFAGKRAPFESRFLPPVPDDVAHERVKQLGFTLGEAAGEGDCYFLSLMAGHELTAAEAKAPTPSALLKVKHVREQCVALVSSPAPIGGMDSTTWRAEEGIPKTPLGSNRALKRFKDLGRWKDRDRRKSTAVMFGAAAHLGRQVAVLEKAHGGYLSPVKIYGAREDGALLRTPAQPGKPPHAPSWVNATFDELLVRIEANPDAFSLIKYNGADHFDPFVRTVAEVSALVAPLVGKKRKQVAQVASPQPRSSKKVPLEPDVPADAPYTPEQGFVVLPRPTVVAIGSFVAHRFDKAAWPLVWASGGRVLRTSSEKGFFEVKYVGVRDIYLHKLSLADYGITRTWVIVEKK